MELRSNVRAFARASAHVAAIVGLLAITTSCENVFTTSPLAFLQRDPTNLSSQQQVTYGEEALASGDPAAMADAYDVLKDSTDPETQLLAADLALGAAEFESVLTSAVAGLTGGGDPQTVLEDAFAAFDSNDLTMLSSAAALVASADDSVPPTAEQYAYAAIGLIAVTAAGNGGVIDPVQVPVQATDFLQAAYDSLQASGESTDLLDGIGSAAGWSPTP